MLIHYFPFEENIDDIKGSGLVLSPPLQYQKSIQRNVQEIILQLI